MHAVDEEACRLGTPGVDWQKFDMTERSVAAQ
jgi:hypothetical protein